MPGVLFLLLRFFYFTSCCLVLAAKNFTSCCLFFLLFLFFFLCGGALVWVLAGVLNGFCLRGGQLVVERDFLADASHQLLGTRGKKW